MSFNVSTFLSQGLTLGGARPSEFDINLGPPQALNSTGTSAAKLNLTARAASLPPMQLGIIQLPYFGRSVKVSGDRVFPEWSIIVMNDEDFPVRAMFERWSNLMNSMVGNIRNLPATGVENYKVQSTVFQYGKAGGIVRSYDFVGMWPSVIDSIDLNWDQTNAIEQFSVSLAYDYWIPSFENGSTDSYASEV